MNTSKISVEEFKENLDIFHGTNYYYSHKLGNQSIILTDGCEYVRNAAESNWLFDAIISYQLSRYVRQQFFQVWRLLQQKDETWKLICEDGNKKVLVEQNIVFSDFPIPEITIWLVDGVAMLPSEY